MYPRYVVRGGLGIDLDTFSGGLMVKARYYIYLVPDTARFRFLDALLAVRWGESIGGRYDAFTL